MAGESYNKYGFTAEDPTARISYYPIAAAQTIVPGDMVFNDGGAITLATAASATLLGPCVSVETTPATGTVIGVSDAPETVFTCRADADVSAAILGGEYDLVGASGAQQLDVGASTTDVLYFLSVVEGQVATAAGCLIRVKINPSKHDLLQ